MNKDFLTQVTPAVPTGSDMEMINRYTRKTLGADDVYIFHVLLCDNEVDRDFERFDLAALKTLAELFAGKTGIFNHSMNARDQTSRLYDTQVVTQGEKHTSTGEPYTFIKAKAYMPRTAKNTDLIAEIDAGIKKEASVGCSVKLMTCSVCGTDLKKEGCEHSKGKSYGGQICHTVLSEPVDAYEWSFVAVPAQRAAGVTKSYKVGKGEERNMEDILKALQNTEVETTLGREEKKSLLTRMEHLEKQAADGKAYREELTMEVIRMGLITLPQMGGESLSSICERLSVEELRELKKAFGERTEKIVPMKPQLKAELRPAAADNNEFRI
ncbi:MAG: hypothetical protein GXZ02_06720 [Clostridiales bacterium]|nr:hypothetical protein [Clostridiales bacterium]